MKKRKHGIETLKSRYGIMFISPWIVGMVLFFIVPIFKSVYYSFAKFENADGDALTSFVRYKNYNEILFKNPTYTDDLFSSFSNMLVSLPFILIVSIVLALLLNGSYKGRIFFRGLYFLPVIIASGAVLQLFLTAASSHATETAVSSNVSFGTINFTDVLKGLNLPESIEKYLSKALSNIFMLVWQSGIQTILIIAGLQSIPDLLYEVSKVEGATKWEEFWYITFPMLMKTMILVIVFTIIELASSNTNKVIISGYNQFNSLEYGIGSAMLWFYYYAVGIFVALIFLIYNKVFLKKWG